ncbi:hypothetical protein [Cryptosporangium japonicum]|uniref:Uncharacterized protein n=1 Tax=Cryptosporangium japonicum TaxID=80872 RepID=A0ABN0V058_9ACTN
MVTPLLDPTDAVGRTARRVLAGRVGGLVLGLAAGATLASGPSSWLGLGLALAAPAFASCLLAGVLVGELLAVGPRPAVRTAALEVRRVRSYLPPVMTRVVAGALVALDVGLVLAVLAGSADDQGRPGRALTLSCGDVSAWVSPWPGLFYALPIAVVVHAALALAAVALRRLVRRPRPGSHPDDRGADDRVRAASARAVTAAVGVLVAAPLAGTTLIASGRLLSLAGQPCAPVWLPVTGWASAAVAAVATVLTGVFVATLVVPRGGRR